MSGLEFTGEIIVVYLRYATDESSKWGWVLKEPQIASLADRKFVCGTLFYREDSWLREQRCRIALDEIAYFIEFDTVDAFLETQAKRKEKKSRPRK